MSYLYLVDYSSKLGFSENCLVVKKGTEIYERVPIETLEEVSVYGNCQITTQCIHECIKKSIPIIYYSAGGKYLGRVQPEGHIGVKRQRKQALFNMSSISFEIAQSIISAKIHNQIVVLRRYASSRGENLTEICKYMKILKNKIAVTSSIEEIMGYEGNAARSYFEGLSRLVESEFHFDGRNRRPPKDPFNAMLSFGYSMLLSELYGKIISKGLNPYFGFIHQDRENHPTLASDLMEEWRPVIVDSAVMSMINGHEISADQFQTGDDGGIYMSYEARKAFVRKLEIKFNQQVKYLKYVDYPVSFRRAIELQINSFAHILDDEENAALYNPVLIR